MQNKRKILLIDQHPEWLEFARGVLGEEILSLGDQTREINGFDLIFIGLELATNNLEILRPLFSKWHFIVVFPVIQENETVRLLFRAGVYDCARKPYERDGLLKLVSDELITAQIANGHSKVHFFQKTKQETLKQLASMLNLENKK
jgi:response regulator RpfG family c-di-GMP phosphodiesterase